MSGEKSNLTSLESRKQLLLLESELNRGQLLEDLNGLRSEIKRLKNQVRGIGSLASSVATLFSLFSVFRRTLDERENQADKPSWVSRLLKGIETGVALWSALRRNVK
jgi:hypothetical protein